VGKEVLQVLSAFKNGQGFGVVGIQLPKESLNDRCKLLGSAVARHELVEEEVQELDLVEGRLAFHWGFLLVMRFVHVVLRLLWLVGILRRVDFVYFVLLDLPHRFQLV